MLLLLLLLVSLSLTLNSELFSRWVPSVVPSIRRNSARDLLFRGHQGIVGF